MIQQDPAPFGWNAALGDFNACDTQDCTCDCLVVANLAYRPPALERCLEETVNFLTLLAALKAALDAFLIPELITFITCFEAFAIYGPKGSFIIRILIE